MTKLNHKRTYTWHPKTATIKEAPSIFFPYRFKFPCVFVEVCTCSRNVHTSHGPGQRRDYEKWIIRNETAHNYTLSNHPNSNAFSLRKLLFKTFQVEFFYIYLARVFTPFTCSPCKLFLTATSGILNWFELSSCGLVIRIRNNATMPHFLVHFPVCGWSWLGQSNTEKNMKVSWLCEHIELLMTQAT